MKPPASAPASPPPLRHSALPTLAGPVAVVLVAAAMLIAGTYALDLWSDGLHPEAAIHARELGGLTLIAWTIAISAVWLMRGWVRSLVRARGPAPGPRTIGLVSFGERLLGVRWLAGISIAAVVFQATLIDQRLEPTSVVLLWTAVALLFVFDAVLTLRGPDEAVAPRAVVLQIAVDTVLLAVCLHAAGGLMNPFAPLLVFHAVIAGLLLPGRLARRAIALVALVTAAMAALEASGLLAARCLRIAGELCAPPDKLAIAASGIAIIALIVGCGLLVSILTRSLQAERDSLARTSVVREREAVELMTARSSLEAEQGKLHTVINCIADAVLFASPDGSILMRNKAADSLWPGRVEGPANDLRVCHTESRWAHMLDKLIHASELEHHPLLPIGGRIYEATYGRVTTGDGATLGAVMVARDVTERLKEEERRAERDRMATIGKLAAALAHEINNPLGSIQLYTQHALRQLEKAGPEAKSMNAALSEHLGTVLRNANVCKKIVRDMLEYARQRAPERRLIEAHALIAMAEKTIRPHADRTQVEVVCEPVSAAGGALVVFVDPDQIGQVIVNLALNAIDAMADNTPEMSRRLTLRVEHRVDSVAIIVDDTGPGLSDAAKSSIFEPFYTTKTDGTGLGLAVATDIARAHKGRVSVEDKADRGARFALVVPISQASDHASNGGAGHTG